MIKYRSPNIKVGFVSVKGDQFETTTLEFGGLILSIHTEKKLSDIPGIFTIVLVGKNDFSEFFQTQSSPISKVHPFELFRPAGLVKIKINDITVMIGMIDSLTKKVTMGDNGKPIRSYTIVGRDLGAFLIEHKIWYDDVVYKNRERQQTLTGSLSTLGIIGNDTSGAVIEKVINQWMVAVVNQSMTVNGTLVEAFEYSDGGKFQDKLIAVQYTSNSYNITNADGASVGTVIGPGAIADDSYADEYPINTSMSMMQGSLSNFIMNFVSPPFNELFVDTSTDFILGSNKKAQCGNMEKCYVVFRPSPFDDDNFTVESTPSSRLKISDLKTYIIDDTIIADKELTISRNQRNGIYYIIPAQGLLAFCEGKYYVPGEYDEVALRRYGYSAMSVSLGGYDVSQKDNGENENIVDSFQKKLKSWYENSDLFMTGAFLISGNEKIRIGNKLEYQKTEEGYGTIEDEYEEGYFYITGVVHDWTYGNRFQTMVEVDRGISKKMFNKPALRTVDENLIFNLYEENWLW